jgi:hypothetical protein
MKKSLPRSTWFFLFIIVGAVVLLLAIYYGFKPEKETNSNLTVNQINQAAGGSANVNQPTEVRPETEQTEEPAVVIENDGVVDLAEAEGMTVQTFESGGMVTVAPVDMEGVMRESVFVVSETPCKVDGFDATHVQAKNVKDGGSVSLIWVKIGDNIYEFKGDESFLTSVMEGARIN